MVDNLRAYLWLASTAAIGAGIIGLLYSASFVVVARFSPALGGGLAAAFLMLGALLGGVGLLGLYFRVAPASGAFASLALILGLGGALAAALHGGYDLGNAIHPPGGTTNAPSQVDPRGFGTFGLAGLSILLFSWLMRADRWPRGLTTLGLASGVLLVLVYLARLIVLDPVNPLVLGPAAVEGFVLNPAWYVWLGLTLRPSG
jgi:hypothetical protein